MKKQNGLLLLALFFTFVWAWYGGVFNSSAKSDGGKTFKATPTILPAGLLVEQATPVAIVPTLDPAQATADAKTATAIPVQLTLLKAQSDNLSASVNATMAVSTAFSAINDAHSTQNANDLDKANIDRVNLENIATMTGIPAQNEIAQTNANSNFIASIFPLVALVLGVGAVFGLSYKWLEVQHVKAYAVAQTQPARAQIPDHAADFLMNMQGVAPGQGSRVTPGVSYWCGIPEDRFPVDKATMLRILDGAESGARPFTHTNWTPIDCPKWGKNSGLPETVFGELQRLFWQDLKFTAQSAPGVANSPFVWTDEGTHWRRRMLGLPLNGISRTAPPLKA